MAKEDTTDKEQAKTAEEQQENVETTEAEATEAKEAIEEPLTEQDAQDKLKAEVGEFKDKYLRLYSEFDNFRKRTAKEKIEFMKSANKDLMLAIIPVIDDMERADKAFDKEKVTVDQVKEGFDLIILKLKKALEKEGLTEIESAVGKTFDVEYHEAVTQFPAPSEDMKGKVVDELEKGYKLGEKVIRFSKVVVGA